MSTLARSTGPIHVYLAVEQCDQIGRFIALRANFQSLWQQLICPNLLPFLGNFCKGVNIIQFSSEIIFEQLLLKFGDFYLVTLLLNDCKEDMCMNQRFGHDGTGDAQEWNGSI